MIAPDDPRLGPRLNRATHDVLNRAAEIFCGTMLAYGIERKEAKFICATLVYANTVQGGTNLNLAAILTALGDATARGSLTFADVEAIEQHMPDAEAHLARAARCHPVMLQRRVSEGVTVDQAFLRRLADSHDGVMYGGPVDRDDEPARG